MRSRRLPWQQRLLAAVPGVLRRMVLRFESAVEGEVAAFGRSIAPGALVLDAGAGECQYAGCFSHCRYVAVDVGVGDADWDYGSLDAIGDLANLPFRPDSLAAALNIVVLEHTRDPAKVVHELHRVLEPGGRLLLVVPLEWAVHQEPHDYFRFTRHGVDLLLEEAGFRDRSIEPVGGFFTLLGRRLLDSVLYFQGGWRWLLMPLVALAVVLPGICLPYLDFMDNKRRSTLGYVCRAAKGGA